MRTSVDGRVELLTSASVAALDVAPGGCQVDVTLTRAVGDRRACGWTRWRARRASDRTWTCCASCGSTSTPGWRRPAPWRPLIDPEHHSCGTVPAHGATTLAHPEPGFFVVGMKSYGRAPTLLLATGYEQVRSVAAHLAGDVEAAGRLELELPETGVCSTSRAVISVPTGLRHGRSASVGASDPRP